jgi:hypothetical protein
LGSRYWLTYGEEHNRIQLIQRGRGIGPTKPRQPTLADAHACIPRGRLRSRCQFRPGIRER